MIKKMMSVLKKKFKYGFASFIFAGLIAVFSYFGGLSAMDSWLQDVSFQTPRATSGKIVVIGIDEEALDEFGPYSTWDRSIIASALDALAADPEHRPSVVAIDMLHSGTTDRAADSLLADAAEALGCVVTADAASFEKGGQIMEDGTYAYSSYNITGFEEPYEQLREVTMQGHINAMHDSDGIMRHAILYIDPPEHERVYSMAYMTASLYAQKHGFSVKKPKTDFLGRFFVSYSAEPGNFYDGVSISQLINGTCPADYFDDKIVFIGPYAAGLQDLVYAPINRGGQMYGVEYQANVIEALLAGNYKNEVSEMLQAILLFFICFIVLLLADLLPFRLTTVICVLIAAGSYGLSVLAYEWGAILHLLWIPAGIAVVYVSAIVLHYIREFAERRRVTRTFERYVAPEIVKEILKEGTDSLQLGGKLCDIAVLFVDVRGFTSMSERLNPELVVSVLNRYLSVTAECIMRNNGTLDKFIGDAAMAFWGAPVHQEDPIFLAVKTAMEIIESVEKVSAEFYDSIGEKLCVGVGVHFGPAVVGNIGGGIRMDYTAIGDTVNTASRLESKAPGGTVYISRAVADALGDRIKTTSLGTSIKLKGKSDFEVLVLDEIV